MSPADETREETQEPAAAEIATTEVRMAYAGMSTLVATEETAG